jgi:signal transduction histidine kinase
MEINSKIGKLPTSTSIAISIIMIFFMGLLDYLTGYEISFSIFYLIPISFLVWYTNNMYGVLVALLSSAVWLTVDVLSGHGYSSNIVYLWNALVRFGFFIVIVYLISRLKKFNFELEKKVKLRTSDLSAEIKEREKAEQMLKQTTQKLRQLTSRIQTIREEENSAIAREIHDELGQALTAIKIDVAWLSKRYSNDSSIVEGLFNISNTIDETIKSVRKISTRLRPRLLDELGLIPAIEWQVKDFQNRTGIKCELKVPEEEIQLESSISSALFRIFQEAITNISRHSKATTASFSISVDNHGVLAMTIRDNGIGLPDDFMNKNHSLGIVGMIERTQSIKGMLEIKNSNESGTEIFITVPIKNNYATK